MKGAVGMEKKGSSDVNVCGPQEMERQRAMHEFRKNVKPGEYIDCDLYGRGDARAFSGLTSTGEGSSKSQKDGVKDKKAGESPKARFVPVNFIARKVRSFLGKLSSKIDCFGRNNSEVSGASKSNEPTATVSPPEQAPKLSDDGLGVRVDTVIADENASVNSGDHRDEEEEMEKDTGKDLALDGIVDGTPHRVKSKVGSGDDLSVVEKGMVMLTLKKLQSTGSFVFKQPSSFAREQEEHKGDDLRSRQSSHPNSENSTVETENSRSSSSKGDGNPEAAPFCPNKASPLRSIECAEEQKEKDAIEKGIAIAPDAHTVCANEVIGGDVQRLRSLYEDDSSGLANTESVAEVKRVFTRETEESSTRGATDSEHFDTEIIEVKTLSLGDYSGTDTSATETLSGKVQKLAQSLTGEPSNVPDKVTVGNVFSAVQVTALTAGREPPHNDEQNVPKLVQCETELAMKGCEREQPMSMKQLSTHLSGRVQRIKSLFESQSGEIKIPDEHEGFKKAALHIRTGLSSDSGAFSESEFNDMRIVDLEEKSIVKDAASRGAEQGAHMVTREGDHEDRDEAAEYEVGRSVHSDDDIVLSGGMVIESSEQNGGDDAAVVEAANEGQEHGRESSENRTNDEFSSSSSANSEDLSQPFSHLVGSCGIM